MMEFLLAILFAILPPCPADEAIGTCKWDAATMGDGQGTSFIVLDDTWIEVR